MRSKQLLLLALLLVVLVAAVVLLKRPSTPTKLADEVGFERILPASLTADAIQGIDLYQGEIKDDTIKLRRQGDTWVVASYHRPRQADKVSKLLDGISGLEGEVRANKAEMLDTFSCKIIRPSCPVLHGQAGCVTSTHLLAGKSSGRRSSCGCGPGSRVQCRLNLRTEAGLFGDETDKARRQSPGWICRLTMCRRIG